MMSSAYLIFAEQKNSYIVILKDKMSQSYCRMSSAVL